MDIHKKISKAKLHLFTKRQTTFFSSLLAYLKLILVEDDHFIKTGGTDGASMWLNKTFIKDMPVEELIGLMLHEVMHCAYQHMDRQKVHNLNHRLWNAAGDFLINYELIKRGYKLPSQRLYDPRFADMGTKEIYDILMEEMPDIEPDMYDLVMTLPKDMTTEEAKEVMISNVVKAVQQAEMAGDPGSVPQEISRMVKELLNPKLPWHVILQNRMSAYSNSDYRWNKPNRRFWPEFTLPSLHSENLNRISGFIDTSGSIDQGDMDAFLAEMSYIFDVLKPSVLNLVTFDTKIHDDLEFTEGDSLEGLQMHGGGGTYIRPVIEKIIDDAPEISIIFTDGEFHQPYLDDLNTDIIWVIKNSPNFPFEPSKGVVIRYE